MLKLFLWLRYLHKKKIAFLSIAAVALSVSLLTAVASLFTSYIHAFETAAADTMGDVVLTAPIKFAKYPLFIERLEQTGKVAAATAILSAEGLLHLGKGKVRAVQIWGIEPARRAKVTGYKQFLLKQKNLPGEPTFESRNSSIGGYTGIAVITEPNEKTDEYDFHAVDQMVGQQVVLTTGTVTENGGQKAYNFKRRTISFVITDVVFTGVYDIDKRFVYLPIEELQKKIFPNETEPVADQIQIKLASDVDTEVALAQIRGAWEVFAAEELRWAPHLIRYTDIQTSQQMQSKYIAALLKQMGVLLVIFGVVSFSVIVLIFCIFYMIVITRRKDIAIIKSCGTSSGSVISVFVGFGAFVGIVGSGIGTVLGYIFTKNINAMEQWIRVIFGLKLWKSSVYMFSRIPNEVNWPWVLWIVLFAVAAAAIGALIPAVIASVTRPVEILRYE
jgi:lipoprotein-releasing system permease protein